MIRSVLRGQHDLRTTGPGGGAMTAGVHSMDRSVQGTKEWIKAVGEELGWKDEQKVYVAMKAVLHGLRDRMPPEEAVHFAAQFPLLLKGIYFDGYTLKGKPERFSTREEFYEKVRQEMSNQPVLPEEITEAVLRAIHENTTTGIFDNVIATMPQDLRGMMRAAMEG